MTTQANPKQDQPAATLTPSPIVMPIQQKPIISLTQQELGNAHYALPDLGEFQLKDGLYENQYGSGATQVNRVNLQTVALGDLNGDGTLDAAVTLAWNGGGSGTFIYLAAMTNDGGAPKQAAVELLGDRTVVKGLSIENGQIGIDLKGFAPGDPQCCPSQGAIRAYKLDGSKLTAVGEVKQTPTVAPSPSPVASIQSRFDPQKYQCSNPPALVLGDSVKAGQDVTLNLRSKLGPATEQFPVTVIVIAPDGSRVSGQAPLNGNDWATVTYPKDFSGARPTVTGVYTILWQVPAGVLDCDGFQVTGS
ncbi:MAG: hypothetical protein WCF84_24330 [Anaerolineae bacterium]